jgi:hypothetical protein
MPPALRPRSVTSPPYNGAAPLRIGQVALNASAIEEMALECLLTRNTGTDDDQNDEQGMEAEERLKALLAMDKRSLVGD